MTDTCCCNVTCCEGFFALYFRISIQNFPTVIKMLIVAMLMFLISNTDIAKSVGPINLDSSQFLSKP